MKLKKILATIMCVTLLAGGSNLDEAKSNGSYSIGETEASNIIDQCPE